jgi:hypothetical protein
LIGCPQDLQNFNLNNHNLDLLLSLYDVDAEHFSPKLKIKKLETNGLVKRKQAFEQLPTLHYKVTSLTANESRVFMEYVSTVQGENDMLVAEVLEIREGRIVFSRVYHG